MVIFDDFIIIIRVIDERGHLSFLQSINIRRNAQIEEMQSFTK
jgi:hypothetical protein